MCVTRAHALIYMQTKLYRLNAGNFGVEIGCFFDQFSAHQGRTKAKSRSEVETDGDGALGAGAFRKNVSSPEDLKARVGAGTFRKIHQLPRRLLA